MQAMLERMGVNVTFQNGLYEHLRCPVIGFRREVKFREPRSDPFAICGQHDTPYFVVLDAGDTDGVATMVWGQANGAYLFRQSEPPVMLHCPRVMSVPLGMIRRIWLVIDQQTRCVPVSQIKGQIHAHGAAANNQNGNFKGGSHGL